MTHTRMRLMLGAVCLSSLMFDTEGRLDSLCTATAPSWAGDASKPAVVVFLGSDGGGHSSLEDTDATGTVEFEAVGEDGYTGAYFGTYPVELSSRAALVSWWELRWLGGSVGMKILISCFSPREPPRHQT